VNLVAAPDGFGLGFRDADVADLALLDEFLQRADRFLDLDLGVDAVEVVEIDIVHAQVPERPLDGLADISPRAVDPEPLAGIGHFRADLGRHQHLVALALEGLGQQHLVLERTVDLGRVEKRDAQLDGAGQRRKILLLVARAVEGAHPHAAEPFGADDETLVAQLYLLHLQFLFVNEFPPRNVR